MAFKFCLTKEGVRKFREGLKSGEINDSLFDMAPKARHAFFAERFGEANAREMNALFESKTLLEDQVRGFRAFANKVGELAKKDGVISPKEMKTHQEKLLEKIEKLDKALTPAQVEEFKQDLVSKAFGGEVTFEQAENISALSKKIAADKAKVEAIINKPGYNKLDLSKESPADRKARVEYGLGVATLKEYMEQIKTGELGKSGGLSSLGSDFVEALKNPKKWPVAIGNLSTSIVASLDDSFWLNQGANALFDPTTTGKWLTAFGKSWGDIASALRGGDPVLGVRAEIFSRPNALNGAYEISKNAIGLHTEEAIPTNVMEKIPFAGRLFKASNAAYNGAALRLRADIFDKWYRENVEKGIDMTDKKNLQSLGERVNAFTGRGYLKAPHEGTNALLFSARFLKSKFDVMTAHVFSETMSAAEKFKAAKSLARLYGVVLAAMALAEAADPGSTELDPRASNYGKIRIGTSWYSTPITFGGIPTLLARITPTLGPGGRLGLWKKDGNGKWTSMLTFRDNDLNQPVPAKYGVQTADEAVEDFFENKSKPVIRALLDFWHGKDFDGNPSTPANLAKNMVTPISPGQIMKIMENEKEQNPGLASFLTFLGSNVTKAK